MVRQIVLDDPGEFDVHYCRVRLNGSDPGRVDDLVLHGPALWDRAGRRRVRRGGEGLPPRDRPNACHRLVIVSNTAKHPSQLDGGGKFPIPLICGADGSESSFGDYEHPDSMRLPTGDRQADLGRAPCSALSRAIASNGPAMSSWHFV